MSVPECYPKCLMLCGVAWFSLTRRRRIRIWNGALSYAGLVYYARNRSLHPGRAGVWHSPEFQTSRQTILRVRESTAAALEATPARLDKPPSPTIGRYLAAVDAVDHILGSIQPIDVDGLTESAISGQYKPRIVDLSDAYKFFAFAEAMGCLAVRQKVPEGGNDAELY